MNLFSFKKNYFVLTIGIYISIAAYGQQIKHDLIIQNINIIDVVKGRILQNQTIAIDSNCISKVYSKNINISTTSKIIEGKGKYIIPGLFDSHIHSAHLTTYNNTDLQNKLKEFVYNGVLYFRDVGGPIDIQQLLKSKIRSGELTGPDIYYTGPMLESSPLLWKNINEVLPEFTVPLNTRNGVDSLLPILAEKGATMIKTFRNIKLELYPHIVDVAEKNNLKIVHDPGPPLFNPVPINKAIELGANSIEHSLSAWGYILKDKYRIELDSLIQQGADARQQLLYTFKLAKLGIESVSEERLKDLCVLIKKKNAVYCPTLNVNRQTLSEFEANVDHGNNDENLLKNKILHNGFVTIGDYIVRKFSENGVKLLIGQDDINPEKTIQEMIVMNEAGVSNIEVLRGATLYAAEWLNLDEKHGSINPSKMANLVILNTNPLEDITNLKDIFMVVQEGVIMN